MWSSSFRVVCTVACGAGRIGANQDHDENTFYRYFVQNQIGGPLHITYLFASKTMYSTVGIVIARVHHAHLTHVQMMRYAHLR